MSVARTLAVVRAHWSGENQLHWVVDVVLDEDAARNRKDNGPENLGVLRPSRPQSPAPQSRPTCHPPQIKLAGRNDEFLFAVRRGGWPRLPASVRRPQRCRSGCPSASARNCRHSAGGGGLLADGSSKSTSARKATIFGFVRDRHLPQHQSRLKSEAADHVQRRGAARPNERRSVLPKKAHSLGKHYPVGKSLLLGRKIPVRCMERDLLSPFYRFLSTW